MKLDRGVTAAKAILFVAIVFAFVFGTFLQGQLYAKGEKSAGVFQNAALANPAVSKAVELNKIQQRFYSEVKKKVASAQRDALFQKKIALISPGEKMAAFMKAVKKERAAGTRPSALLNALSKQNLNTLTSSANGSISGTVTIEGTFPAFVGFGTVSVVIFDSFGFFVKSVPVNTTTGAYTVSDLPAGDYFVVTESEFADEMFDDILVNDYQDWRNATLVNVTDGGAVTGIDFDLQKGAVVSGTVIDEDTGAPLSFGFLTFTFTAANNPAKQIEVSDFTDNFGHYKIHVPATGTFKVMLDASGFQPEYFNNQTDFVSADPIVISSFADSLGGIDFSLSAGTQVEGGQIVGTVFGPSDQPVAFAFVFAFNVADTSIAGFTLSGFSGEYEISGLDDGMYIVYADQLLDLLLPPALEGEYYDNAKTSDAATPLTIAGSDTLTGINFSLESGGAISGTISSDSGAPLDSVLVVAVKLDISNVGKFFTDDIDFGVAFSDATGKYVVSGLSSGDYTLRTVAALGKHGNVFLDEYYDDVHSLFDAALATQVTVTSPDTTSGIDFALTEGGVISGHFFETDGATPVVGFGNVIAFDTGTGYPELALSKYDSVNGTYVLRPLPTGMFKLLGVVTANSLNLDLGLFAAEKDLKSTPTLSATGDDIIYLPQFYNGKSSLDTADEVAVTAPGETADKDFLMVRAGTVQGVVNLAPGVSAGADSLSETTVLAFDANSGELIGGSGLTFAGGYQILGLPPVNVKVVAMPASNGYAATYFGGGATFNDGLSTPVSITPGNTSVANIDLATGAGQISGTVYNGDGTIPLDGVLVIAFDATGHAVSAAVSGFDENFVMKTTPGKYTISGLRSGSYFLRTISIFSLFSASGDLGLNTALGGGDPLTLIFGLLGNDNLFGSFDIQLYNDVWYDGQEISLNLADVDIFSLLFNLFTGGGDLHFILPFFDTVPAGASAVTVSSPGLTDGIDFRLPTLENFITSVRENPSTTLPEQFILEQNYPNPFNPSTEINYTVPEQSQVTLQIFNMLGQRIRTLVDAVKTAGAYSSRWDGLDDKGNQVAAGIYFFKLKSANVALTRKMLLIK